MVRNPFHVYSKKVKAGSGLEYREIFKLIGGTEDEHLFWSKYGIFNVPPTKRQ